MKRKFLFFLLRFGLVAGLIGGFLSLGYICVLINSALPMFIFFGCIALLSILMVPFYLKRIVKEVKRQGEMTEEERKEDVNQDGSKLSYDAYQVKAVIDNWKQASTADKIKGMVFLFFFLGCCIGFVVLISLGHITLGLICFGVGAGLILTSLIVVKMLQRRSLKLKKGRSYTKEKAIVVSCSLSSQTTTGTRHRKYIGNTTYKVNLKLSSGQKVVAYSKEFYDIGDRLSIAIDEKNPQIVHIIQKQEDMFDIEEDEY